MMVTFSKKCFLNVLLIYASDNNGRLASVQCYCVIPDRMQDLEEQLKTQTGKTLECKVKISINMGSIVGTKNTNFTFGVCTFCA